MSLTSKNDNANEVKVSPSDAMQVNTVKPLEDFDFKYLKQICDDYVDWNLKYEKKLTKVWIKSTNNIEELENNDTICSSKFRIIKVF